MWSLSEKKLDSLKIMRYNIDTIRIRLNTIDQYKNVRNTMRTRRVK